MPSSWRAFLIFNLKNQGTMNKKEITINGKQYQVAFDLQTMLNYEQNVGRSFFTIDFNNLSLENRINLIHAAVKSADENMPLTVDDIKGNGNLMT